MHDKMEQDIFTQNVPFFEEPLIKMGVPKLTRWRSLRGLLKPFWIAEGDYRIRFYHSVLKIYPYFLEVILIPITYFLFCKYYFPSLPENTSNEKHFFFCRKSFQLYFMGYIFFTCMFALIWSHLKDPGYLPFYFPAFYNNQEKRTAFTHDEMRWGLAITDEQIEWARAQHRPDRICFSESTGYYVIRGDHICTYINNWVGLYNHRWFVILLFHLMLYIFNFLFVFLYTQFVIHTLNGINYMTAVLLLIGIPFLVLISGNFLNQMFCIRYNILLKDVFKGEYHDFNLGSQLANCEVVFGSRKYILFWLLPVPLPLHTNGFDFHEKLPADSPKPRTDNNDATNTMFNPLHFTEFTRNRNEITV